MKADLVNGLYIAHYCGISGWYWHEPALQLATVALQAKGGLAHRTVFEGAAPTWAWRHRKNAGNI